MKDARTEHPSPRPRHFADRLLETVAAAGSPACVGIDPVVDRLPEDVLAGAASPAEAIGAFSLGVLDAVAGAVGVVKVQSACFERYGGEGVESMRRVLAAARERGLVTILDAKRGDVGVSAAHYAESAFGFEPCMDADALTVNMYMGPDTLEPYLHAADASDRGRGLFVLVRTSNTDSDAIQTQQMAAGGTVAAWIGDLVAQHRLFRDRGGAAGYTDVGAVVAATKPKDAATLRAGMPKAIFLVPGYGTQGGDAESVKELFNSDGTRAGTGAIVTASRSVLYQADGGADWKNGVAEAAKRFAGEIAAVAGG